MQTVSWEAVALHTQNWPSGESDKGFPRDLSQCSDLCSSAAWLLWSLHCNFCTSAKWVRSVEVCNIYLGNNCWKYYFMMCDTARSPQWKGNGPKWKKREGRIDRSLLEKQLQDFTFTDSALTLHLFPCQDTQDLELLYSERDTLIFISEARALYCTSGDNCILSNSYVSNFAHNRCFYLAVSIPRPQSTQGACDLLATGVKTV